MKTITKIFLMCSIFFVSMSLAAIKNNKEDLPITKTDIRFIENKGQVGDQNNNPRPDVLFSGATDDMIYHLTKSGISYQLTSWQKQRGGLNKKIKVTYQSTTFRIDSRWKGANTNFLILKGIAYTDINNYYSEVCPLGVIGVQSYKEVTYSNLYNGIDLKWYEKNGQLKYDYNVAAGIDYKQIQIEINGATKISINKNGELMITTPLGNLIEHAPIVFQNNKILPASWIINTSNNTVSFSIQKLILYFLILLILQ